MIATTSSCVVTVAFAQIGKVAGWRATMTRDEVERLTQTLGHMAELGALASFAIEDDASLLFTDVVDQLRRHCGPLMVEACLNAPSLPRWTRPALLMPVWAFDHEIDGRPASTGQLLGVDLELVAIPSPDEESGAILPGRDGRWLIEAHTMF